MHELGDVGEGEDRPEEREQGQHGLAGLHQGVVDDPLGAEARGRRHADDGEARHEEHEHGEGHLAAKAAEVAQVVSVRHAHDGAADEEEQVLEEDVVDEVEQAAGEAERLLGAGGERVAADRHGEDHVAYLAHGRVDEDELHVVGAHGLPGRKHDGDAADPHDEAGLAHAVEGGGAGAEDEEELAQADDGALQEHRGDVAGHRRGRHGGMHLPVDA